MVQSLEDTIINQYRITHLLARGGMAKIYLAEDIQTEELVAIKLVHNNDENYYQRFRREIHAIAELQHEHILPALGWGDHEPWCYMVMPYIQHGTLANLLLDDPLSLEEAGEILTQIADALQHAHEHGIVHRDIKPSNVLMRDKHYAYLADFGLVKDTGTDHSLTQSGYLIGTPEYIAPEMLEGPATPISDTYALGVLLYQMLTGHVPFTGTTPIEIMWKHVQERPDPPSRLNPAIPPAIDQVVLRALQKNPKRRFQSAYSFQKAYQNALTVQNGVWKLLDTNMHRLRSTTKEPLNQLLRPGIRQAYLTSLTQHDTMQALDIQDMPTCARRVVNVTQPFTTKIHPVTLIELSIILLITLSLSLLSFGIFSSHPTLTPQTDHSPIQPLRKIPMKISILITVPSRLHSSTLQSIYSLPPLKPSLVLRSQYTNRNQTQSSNGYSNSQDDDNNNYEGNGQGNSGGSRSNHSHHHSKHSDG